MEKEYEAKEEARMLMREAIENYIRAAETYGSGREDIAGEIQDVFVDLGEAYKITLE